jgi:hypothetical protein
MNEELLDELISQSGITQHILSNPKHPDLDGFIVNYEKLDKFTKLIVCECVSKIEMYPIPVGNSAAGEIACELTYAALREIRDDIKELFGVSNE